MVEVAQLLRLICFVLHIPLCQMQSIITWLSCYRSGCPCRPCFFSHSFLIEGCDLFKEIFIRLHSSPGNRQTKAQPTSSWCAQSRLEPRTKWLFIKLFIKISPYSAIGQDWLLTLGRTSYFNAQWLVVEKVLLKERKAKQTGINWPTALVELVCIVHNSMQAADSIKHWRNIFLHITPVRLFCWVAVKAQEFVCNTTTVWTLCVGCCVSIAAMLNQTSPPQWNNRSSPLKGCACSKRGCFVCTATREAENHHSVSGYGQASRHSLLIYPYKQG